MNLGRFLCSLGGVSRRMESSAAVSMWRAELTGMVECLSLSRLAIDATLPSSGPNQPGNPLDAALVWIVGFLPASRGIETLARWLRPLGGCMGPGQGEAVSRGRSVVFEYPSPDILGFWACLLVSCVLLLTLVGFSYGDGHTRQLFVLHLSGWSLLRCDLVSSV